MGMSSAPEVRVVAVLGAGTMGHGIAQLAAMAGYRVMLLDVEASALQRALERIRWSLGKFAERGALGEDVEEVVARIRTTTDLAEAVGEADFVVEAVPEDLGLKRRVFREADSAAPPHAILSSNTSTLPITELAEATQRPEKVVGTHFFNPPQLMPLVEVVKGRDTSEETLGRAVAWVRSLGKEVVVCRKDVAGFIVNRVLLPLLDEAAWVVRRGEAEVEEVDSAFRYKLAAPMGPFELMDYSGIDVVYGAMKEVKRREPDLILFCPLIEEMYKRGWWGRKAGRGFYVYPTEARKAPEIPEEVGKGFDPLQVLAPAVNSAAKMLSMGVVGEEELEKAVRLGLGLPDGILGVARKLGIGRVIDILREKAERHGPYYNPCPKLLEMGGKRDGGAGEGVLVHREPPLAWILLNRPEKLNAFTPEMVDELERALEGLKDDEEVRVVVIRGVGSKAFSAGADVEALKEFNSKEAERASRRWKEVFGLVERFPKPVVAAIEGYCLGAGLELALACDFRVASEDGVLGQPEVELGLIPGAGGTQRLTRVLGPGRAKEVIMLGKRLGADEALWLGLLNAVYPKKEFDGKVREFAEKLAAGPPIALKFVKQAISLAASGRFDEGFELESKAFGGLFETEDAREGVEAFLSGRKPRFKGR